jgi:hypothetical protein
VAEVAEHLPSKSKTSVQAPVLDERGGGGEMVRAPESSVCT